MITKEVKSYDSSGIIPKLEEDQQSYVERARIDLDALKQFYGYVKEKRVESISIRELKGLERMVTIGGYEVLENPSMREYGFEGLFIPTVAIANGVFSQLFVDLNKEEGLRATATNVPVQYGGRKLPFTVINEDQLEVDLSKTGLDYSDESDLARPILEDFAKNFLTEGKKRDLGGHETIHGIRRLAGFLEKSYHFEELLGYSNARDRVKMWNKYFSGIVRYDGLSLSHPFRSLRRLAEHDYLKGKVENGVAEKFPLPLLVRISDREFIDIARQIEKGRDVKAIVNEKSESKSKDAWRWELIAEICGS